MHEVALPESYTQLARGRWLLADPETLVDDGAVAFAGGRIREIGPWPALRTRYPEAPVHGSADHAVIPGLINAHHHSNGVSALQQGVPDRLLELWLLSLATRRRADPYLSTLLSAARLLRTGVTAVVDVLSGRGTAVQVEAGAKAALRAYEQAGMRAALALGMTEESFLVWGEDAAFMASLPADVRALAERRLPPPGSLAAPDYLDLMDGLCRQFREHPRLAVWFGPPGPQWNSDGLLTAIAERAERLDTRVQTHLLESVYEKLHGPRQYGRSTLLHLRDLGILSPRVSFAHGVWLTKAEIDVLAESGAHVSHNPGSNLRLRAGMAPLNAILAAGASVALGMDGTTLNDDEDMFAEMRLALNLHRTPRLDGPAPTVEQIWGLATQGGARLLGAADHLGRLAPGFAADLVLLRLDRLTWPWVAPEADPRLLLLGRARAGDVDAVLVDGDLVLRDGRLVHIDEVAVAAELAESLRAAPYPEDAAAMVAELMPYVAAHYRQWPFPNLDPYDAFNSRQ